MQRVQFRRQAAKPYYILALAILEPSRFSGRTLSSRLYCNPKALWKLNWFLRDFDYDTELLGRDEVDEGQLLGLKGVVKVSQIVINGASLTGQETEPWEIVYFKLYQSQMPVIEKAIETAALMLGSD